MSMARGKSEETIYGRQGGNCGGGCFDQCYFKIVLRLRSRPTWIRLGSQKYERYDQGHLEWCRR
jgi:hypothetical protein